ncbi:MAG: hypothetical protein AAF280_07805 [Pseudomonadota bacterium]
MAADFVTEFDAFVLRAALIFAADFDAVVDDALDAFLADTLGAMTAPLALGFCVPLLLHFSQQYTGCTGYGHRSVDLW